ncbi:MAG: NAD(P)H-binding protein [Solirubrobacterales bacterium]|nr:NAD(P)H-binding protein [Solirubrobacterales bacterium]
MATLPPLDLVTGAFSYSGSYIAQRLLHAGRGVRTLSFHPDRPHPLQASVQAFPYRFDDPAALRRTLEGVSTLYNTYWVRFDHGQTSFEQAIERSDALFTAARQAGVDRIVHLSITNASITSPLPYFRGKALVEDALARVGVPYSIVRPTMIFGGDRDVLVNNIAWILRRMPVFAVPGSGGYPVQPIDVEDLARICTDAAEAGENEVIDAAGPETMPFGQLVALIRRGIGARARIVHVPAPIMTLAARALGLVVHDVVLTPHEIEGLMAGLLVSHEPPLGQTRFTDWLDHNATSIGRRYANELQRHFASSPKVD